MCDHRLIVSICLALAFKYAVVTGGSGESVSQSSEEIDDSRCFDLESKLPDINETCAFNWNRNYTKCHFYEFVTAFECVYYELLEIDLFAEKYNECQNDTKEAPYSHSLACGIEVLNCTIERIYDACPTTLKAIKLQYMSTTPSN